MSNDELKGKTEQARGKGKEIVGKVTGNKDREVEGKADQLKGKVQEAYGKAKEKVKDLKD